MQYLLPVTVTDRYSLCTKLPGNIWDKLNLIFFNIPPITARVAVMYFMVKSCIHTVQLPEPDQNVSCLSRISPASTEFHKIPRKHRNSWKTVVPVGKVPCTTATSTRLVVALVLAAVAVLLIQSYLLTWPKQWTATSRTTKRRELAVRTAERWDWDRTHEINAFVVAA